MERCSSKLFQPLHRLKIASALAIAASNSRSLPGLTSIWAISVIMVVPLGILGALAAATTLGLQNDVYFQVGLLTTIGLFDTWTGLIIPYITFALPLSIYTLSAFFREIPWDLEKAAKMDGATPAQAFSRVIVPLAAPGIVTTAILVFIFAWNDLLLALSLTATKAAITAPVAIANFTGSSQFEEPTGSIAAGAMVITVPIIVFVLVFQRRIVTGLTSGAVKG